MIPGGLNMGMMGGGVIQIDPSQDLTLVESAGGDFTTTATRITANPLERDSTAYAYYDAGAGVLGSYSIDFDLYYSSLDADYVCSFMDVKDTLGSMSDEPYIGGHQGAATLVRARLMDSIGGPGNLNSSTSKTVSTGTLYYCRITRSIDDDEVALYFASSAGNRDSETWTNSLVLDTSTSDQTNVRYRYLYIWQSFDLSGTGQSMNAYIENIKITLLD